MLVEQRVRDEGAEHVGALRRDITVEQATEWLIGVHLSLLGPVFADRPRAHRAEMLRTFVAYALLERP